VDYLEGCAVKQENKTEKKYKVFALSTLSINRWKTIEERNNKEKF